LIVLIVGAGFAGAESTVAGPWLASKNRVHPKFKFRNPTTGPAATL